MKKKISGFIAFVMPSPLANILLNLLGHQIHKTARIGFTWLQCQNIRLDKNASIGHFNLIRIPILRLEEGASIRQFNRMKGSFHLLMSKRAAIGNSNNIYRAPRPVTLGESMLKMGELAIITSKHSLDCTRSISIGDFTTISGFDTQFWTHGYYHENQGEGRVRIDGEIHIGHNVSVGSRCVINPGVNIGNAINVGGNACVSKSIEAPGMYVSQALRYISVDIDTIKNKLIKNNNYTIDEVYEK